MTYLNILEKLQILFDMILNFKIILVLIIALIVLTLLYIINRIDKKKYILTMLLSFTLTFVISVIGNYKILSNTFDNFATIFFGNIYFPSIYVYIVCLVVSLIVFIVSVLNKTLKKSYKVVNSINFIINNIIFNVVINIIAKNKIDIFSISSLYTNKNLVAILEINMTVIIIWLLSLLTIYATNYINERLTSKKKIVVVNEDTVPEITTNKEVIPEVVMASEEVSQCTLSADEISAPIEEVVPEVVINEEIASDITTINNENVTLESIISEEKTDTLSFNDILNGGVEVVYYDNNINDSEYNIINPQEIYENKYIKLEDKIIDEPIIEKSIIEPIVEPTIEKKTIIEEPEVTIKKRNKASVIEEDNTSINDIVLENDKYSVDDYKKFAKMLSDLKSHSRRSNITIDDAVTISLISNYSVEDCIRFKEILESNLI